MVEHTAARKRPHADLTPIVRRAAGSHGGQAVGEILVVARHVLIAEHRQRKALIHDLLDGLIARRGIGRKGRIDHAGAGSIGLGDHQMNREREFALLHVEGQHHLAVLRLARPIVVIIHLNSGADFGRRGRRDAEALVRIQVYNILSPLVKVLRVHLAVKERRQTPCANLFLHHVLIPSLCFL